MTNPTTNQEQMHRAINVITKNPTSGIYNEDNWNYYAREAINNGLDYNTVENYLMGGTTATAPT